MLALIVDSAMRSLLLGLAVCALLKFARLCDTRAETAIWTTVLIAALSMPLLCRYTPALVMTLPHLPGALQESAAALRLPAANHIPPARDGVVWHMYLLEAYALGVMVCLTRLGIGLLLVVRLYRRSVPVSLASANGRNVRASSELNSPVSLANTILLPADYATWSAAKRIAVLAHEEAHIARADFFVQLAARIHCAFFWFSPFAWWLQSKLAIVAETASDEAAILRLNDRVAYAEILIEVSRCARKTPLFIGMAKGPFIEQRVEHILADASDRNLSLPLRAFAVAALAALACAVAGAKAVVGPVAADAKTAVAAVAPARASGVAPQGAPAGTPKARVPASSGKHAAGAPGAPTGVPRAAAALPERRIHGAVGSENHADGVTYNPRALLDSVYAPRPDYEPALTVVHAGRAFYIRSNERPVADVTTTYGSDRRTH